MFMPDGAAWQAEKTTVVPIVDDTEAEDDETLQVKIEIPAGDVDGRLLYVNPDGTRVGFSDRRALITIIDDDTPEVTITADAPSVTYLTGDATSFNPAFTVTRSIVTAAALDVQVTLADVPFLTPVGPQTVTIPANEASAKLIFTDSDFFRRPGVEVAGGALTATVQPDADYDVGAASEATMDIVVFMTVRIGAADYTVAEDAGPLAVTLIARTGVGASRPGVAVAVAFDTLAGTAVDTAGGDFVAVSAFDRRVEFAPGDFAQVGGVGGFWEAEQTVEVTIGDDAVDEENDEAFTVMLSALAGQGLVVPVDLAGQNPGPQAVPVTITDDDNPVVTITANRSKVTFPGYFAPVFTLRRATDATAAPLEVMVDLALTGESLYVNNLPLTRTVTIPAGETSREFTVGLISEFNYPAGAALESGVLTVTVQAAADYDLGADGADGVASVDIVPFMTVRIEQPDYTVDEGAGTLAVTIIAQTGEGATWPPVQSADLVNFTPLTGFTISTFTESDTAIYDQDFVPLNEIVRHSVWLTSCRTATPGGREQTVTVTILDDAANDDGEMFELRLERTGGLDFRIRCVNADRTFETCGVPAPVTITDNDAPVVVTPPDDALVGNTGRPGNSVHRPGWRRPQRWWQPAGVHSGAAVHDGRQRARLHADGDRCAGG